jgi:multicomponent Na+:H+ antiporter subunit G
MLDTLGVTLMGAGALFFVAGSVGLLRFPDVFCRLHALTKADGLGLALICAGAALGAESLGEVLRIVLVWAFAALASATGSHMIARHARHADGARPREMRG